MENSYTQAEIDDKLSSKAPLESPAFTGTPTAPTPDKTANNTQIATTAFVHSTLNKIVEEGAYLPLTGGAMEGSIVLGSSSEIIKGNGKYNLVFAANTKFDNGANFILYPPGTSNTEFAGGFTLRTMDDNNIVFLEGTPKGSFKWNNKEIVRSVNGVVAGADGDVVIEIPKPDLSKYVPTSEVGNAANKIPKYNTSGHLVLPNGAEFWIA